MLTGTNERTGSAVRVLPASRQWTKATGLDRKGTSSTVRAGALLKLGLILSHPHLNYLNYYYYYYYFPPLKVPHKRTPTTYRTQTGHPYQLHPQIVRCPQAGSGSAAPLVLLLVLLLQTGSCWRYSLLIKPLEGSYPMVVTVMIVVMMEIRMIMIG